MNEKVLDAERAGPKNNRRCATLGFDGPSREGIERIKTKGIIIFMFFPSADGHVLFRFFIKKKMKIGCSPSADGLIKEKLGCKAYAIKNQSANAP